MTRDESRTLAITAGVLFLAGGVRAGLEVMRPPLAIHADTVSAQALATTSREMLDEEERRSAPLAPGERIDPNTAAEEELDRLPGIGPAAARAIVESRAADGPFAEAGALARVRGIGPATVDRLRPHLAFETSGGGRPVRRGAAGARPATAPGGASPVNPQDAIPMDLNRATAEELEDVSRHWPGARSQDHRAARRSGRIHTCGRSHPGARHRSSHAGNHTQPPLRAAMTARVPAPAVGDDRAADGTRGSTPLRALLEEMVERGASDLHITAGIRPRLRIDGETERLAHGAQAPSARDKRTGALDLDGAAAKPTRGGQGGRFRIRSGRPCPLSVQLLQTARASGDGPAANPV